MEESEHSREEEENVDDEQVLEDDEETLEDDDEALEEPGNDGLMKRMQLDDWMNEDLFERQLRAQDEK